MKRGLEKRPYQGLEALNSGAETLNVNVELKLILLQDKGDLRMRVDTRVIVALDRLARADHVVAVQGALNMLGLLQQGSCVESFGLLYMRGRRRKWKNSAHGWAE